MGAVDLKDMTASELLRWAANGNPDNGYSAAHQKLFSALSGESYGMTTCDADARNLRALADKIDAEIEAARKDAVKESKKPMWWFRSAIRRGEDWPEPRDGEKFREYLERCFIPRPRYEDGEPVQFGEDTDKLHEVEKFIFTRSGGCCQMQDARGNMQNAFPGQRVKRRAPEALGADGLPIVEGETVYPISGSWIGCPLEVAGINSDGSVRLSLPDGKGWTCYLADFLTHTPPDTQERIDEDARKSTLEYWGCGDAGCGHCPAKIEGKIPRDRLNARNCEKAMLLDLLRRQRELDASRGGVE